MTSIKESSCAKSFGGFTKIFSHESSELKCHMNFAVILPSNDNNEKLPVIYWLSGLTCTEQNFSGKAGAQRYAQSENVIIVAPDTSPRGCKIEGEEDSWDFGTGAGFYVDATEKKWKTNYRMYSYITKELPAVIAANFSVQENNQSIMGHSMGGHGALICALKNPGLYKSVSAIAPISNPINCPWGKKALTGYLGPDESTWKEYDATELVKNYNGPPLEILIDQGNADNFYIAKQLLPENFVAATREQSNHVAVILRNQEGYDHSYYFISTVLEDHVKHHMRFLRPS